MRYLTPDEVRRLHELVIDRSGGGHGLLDIGKLEAAIAQPQMTWGGEDLYPSLHEKAAALAFSLCQSHAFVDGNKRIAHAALEAFLICNGFELEASVDEQERLFTELASGLVPREAFTAWVHGHLIPLLR